MTLSSWTLDNTRLELDFDGHEKLEDFGFATFSESNEWTLVESSAWKHMAWYHFEQHGSMEWTELVYSLTIQRHVRISK